MYGRTSSQAKQSKSGLLHCKNRVIKKSFFFPHGFLKKPLCSESTGFCEETNKSHYKEYGGIIVFDGYWWVLMPGP